MSLISEPCLVEFAVYITHIYAPESRAASQGAQNCSKAITLNEGCMGCKIGFSESELFGAANYIVQHYQRCLIGSNRQKIRAEMVELFT